ncbi:unnamed protein product [Acanthoscelides obtectus]|uniref:Protein inturned n=1 Tax=Acanthoscelides obtectus TaxID=200917 RepID=A0A9P0JTJ3_ACAOB|nr:unnamed protein product [Acanthoscelides obtectus]CAK1640714.1 Protein inturned [Acanthoscelides obtectus]
MDSDDLLGPLNESKDDYHSSDEEDEWSDGSSYSSYYSDSNSTAPDWEPYVDDFTGELLYIECHPFVVQHNKDNKPSSHREFFTKSHLRHSTRGKFLRLIRKRESKRKKKNQKPLEVADTSTTSKVKFQDSQDGEEKEVLLEIDAENRHNLSSDKSLAESLLGLVVSALSDGNRVMIAGFSYDSKAKHERNIKIGDWLKSINDIEVNVDNLDDILQKFINRDVVLLKLQRVTGVDVTKDPPINELNNESIFVKEFLSNLSNVKDEQRLMHVLCARLVGMVYINTENLKESNKDNEDIVYCFPTPVKSNVLSTTRGMYITLNHLLNEITKSKPQVSSIDHNGQTTHIAYNNFGSKLLLFMLPDVMASRDDTLLISKKIVRLLEFTYDSIDSCFADDLNICQLNHFLARFFAGSLGGDVWCTIQQLLETEEDDLIKPKKQYYFEDLLSVVPVINLTDEANMLVDDALTELEASDYREWNEEPLDCQRLFTIIGSAYYHSGYLVTSHFIEGDLIDVNTYCKLHGYFHLSKSEPVKSLVLWREVFPVSCRKTDDKTIKCPEGKRYLLIVGSGKDLLTVIMEAGGCTEPAENNMGPDAFYVEEVQATLAHIQEVGISELANRILSTDSNEQIALPVPNVSKKKGEFININFSKATSSAKDLISSPKKNEVTSILKRRSSDQNFINHQGSSSNVSVADEYYDRQSEGSELSQGGYSEKSEISDDSSKNFRRVQYDDDSDTDGDHGDDSQLDSSFDVPDIRQSLDSEEYRLVQLTAGQENVLIHFSELNITRGVLLYPLEPRITSQTYEVIVPNFKRCSLEIHRMFQNTLRFTNTPTQEIAKSMMNKSLVGIKEYGILFECPYLDAKDKKNKIKYWVIGRLFSNHHAKEIYVCYRDGIPQNLIDIAFKMEMSDM